MKITVPRITGLLLILLSLLSFFLRGEGFILGITGLIFILAPSDYAKKQFDWFVMTFSNSKIILVTFLYDAFSWLLIAELGMFYLSRAENFVSKLEAGGLKLALTNPALASNAANSLKELATFFIVGIFLLIIASFIVYNIFRFLSWTAVSNQKFSKKLLAKFFGLNAFIWLFWLVIIVLLAISLKTNPVMITVLTMLLIVAGYFTLLIHSLFIKTHRIGYSISNGLGIGIGKIHRLIVPFALAITLFVIVSQLFKLILFLAPQFLQAFISFLLLILYLAWLRFYSYKIVVELPRSEI